MHCLCMWTDRFVPFWVTVEASFLDNTALLLSRLILGEINLVIKDVREEFGDVLFLRFVLGDASLDNIIEQLL